MKLFKVFTVWCCVFAIGVVCVAQEKKDAEATDTKVDPASLVGDWVFESGVRAGEDVDKARLGSISISEKEFTIPIPEAEPIVMAYKIDSDHSPAHIDVEITAGPAPPSETKGIIAVVDGKIQLCYHPEGGDRPEAFESTAENGFFLFVIKPKGLTAKDLVGTWSYASGTRAGEEVPAERLTGDVIFTEETVTLPAGEMTFVMSYELNSDTSPVEIDLSVKEGPAPEGSAAKGIIKKVDGHIVFCYDSMGANRPESFESTGENGFFMFKLKVKDE